MRREREPNMKTKEAIKTCGLVSPTIIMQLYLEQLR